MIKGKGVSVGVGFGNTVILKNEERKIRKNRYNRRIYRKNGKVARNRC